jgi:hypothetical protein
VCRSKPLKREARKEDG